jgi:(R)-2-hydroxyacyl-CoA dehydratese activating ATPase
MGTTILKKLIFLIHEIVSFLKPVTVIRGREMTWYMGVDIGSVTTKGVITGNGQIETSLIVSSGSNYRMAAEKLREELLNKAGLQPKDITRVAVTGRSADRISFGDRIITDMLCCARGINRLFPEARTVIDVQGQSSQVLRVGEKGQLINFAVSEKCASGSGWFLDIISNVLQIKIEEIGPLSLLSEKPVVFTTGCAVFGESEAISRVAEGFRKEDIIAGVNNALADKTASLANRVGLEEPVAMSGGGGLNIGLIKSIEERLGVRLLVPRQPQLVTALGAAIIVEEETTK